MSVIKITQFACLLTIGFLPYIDCDLSKFPCSFNNGQCGWKMQNDKACTWTQKKGYLVLASKKRCTGQLTYKTNAILGYENEIKFSFSYQISGDRNVNLTVACVQDGWTVDTLHVIWNCKEPANKLTIAKVSCPYYWNLIRIQADFSGPGQVRIANLMKMKNKAENQCPRLPRHTITPITTTTTTTTPIPTTTTTTPIPTTTTTTPIPTTTTTTPIPTTTTTAPIPTTTTTPIPTTTTTPIPTTTTTTSIPTTTTTTPMFSTTTTIPTTTKTTTLPTTTTTKSLPTTTTPLTATTTTPKPPRTTTASLPTSILATKAFTTNTAKPITRLSSKKSTSSSSASTKNISNLLTTLFPTKHVSTDSTMHIVESSTNSVNSNYSTTNNLRKTSTLDNNYSTGQHKVTETISVENKSTTNVVTIQYPTTENNLNSSTSIDNNKSKMEQLKRKLHKKRTIIISSVFGTFSVIVIICLIVWSIRRARKASRLIDDKTAMVNIVN